jgi:hypothetical protein
MPRGHYDRTKSKAKKAAAAVSAAPHAAPSFAAPKTVKAAAPVSAVQAGDVVELYGHMRELTAARSALSAPGADHNPSVLKAVDGEIESTVKSLSNWRETKFPTTIAAKEEIKPPLPAPRPAVAQVAPVPVSAQPGFIAPAPLPAPPLPFTPTAVQEALKNAQTQPS